MPQKPNYESKKIRVLRENGRKSKLKHRKAHNSILSGIYCDPYGRPVVVSGWVDMYGLSTINPFNNNYHSLNHPMLYDLYLKIIILETRL